MATTEVKNITNDEIRVTFASVMSEVELDVVTNYVISPSTVEIKKVLVPKYPEGSISYVDLHVKGLVDGQSYAILLSNLYLRDGTPMDPELIMFSTGKTKSEKLMDSIPAQYDTSIKSIIRHLFLAVGLSDETIGGVDHVSRRYIIGGGE